MPKGGPPSAPPRPHARLRACLRVLACAWLIALAGRAGAEPRNPSEPPRIAALRADQTRSAADLYAEASRLRKDARPGAFQAWAMLAEAEFANDQELADAALDLLDETLRRADTLKLADLRFAALARKSVILVNRGRNQETEQVLAQMQHLADTHDDAAWKAQWLHERAVLERKRGDFEQARASFEQSRVLLNASGDRSGEARALNSIGMIDGRTGRFSDAMAMHSSALALARAVQDQGETARSLRLLGILYRNLDDEELATRHLLQALQYVEQRNRREAITLHGELIGAFTRLEQFDKAERHGLQAARLAEESGSHPNRVNAFIRLAELRLLQGRIDEAAQWVEKAQASFDKVAVRDQILVRQARLRVLAARGQVAAALPQAVGVLADTRKLGDKIIERSILDLLSELQLQAGDAASAFATRKAHQKLDKELAIDVASRRIALLEADIERQRGEAERELLQRDNQIQSLTLNRQRLAGLMLIAGLATLLAIAALLYSRYRNAVRHRNAISASRDELERLNKALVFSSGELERAATTDSLTGLANRGAASRLLQRLLSTRPEPLTVMLLDLDEFKRINDSHGHQAGDAVLRGAALRLRDALPENATLARWGGEEFIAVLRGSTLRAAPPEEPAQIAERMRASLAASPVLFEGRAIPVTVSIGLATVFGSADMDDVLADADAALYRAKGMGRNRVVYAAPIAEGQT